MAQFNTKDNSIQDISFQQEPGQKVGDVSSIQGRISALEKSLSRAVIRSTDHPKPDLQKTQKGKVLSSPPEKQRYTDRSGSSVSTHLTNVEIKSEVQDSNHISRKKSVSHSLAKPVCPHISRPPIIKAKTLPVLKPGNQKPNVSSSLNVNQSSNISLTEISSVTKQENCLESVVRVKTVSTKPAKLLETPKPSCITKSKTSLQSQKITVPPIPMKKHLPHVNLLGNPPLKPTRPTTFDVQQFRTSLKEEPGENMPHPIAPSHLVFPQSPHVLTSQQLDEEKTYDNVDMKLPPLLQKGYKLKEAEVQSFQKHEESNSGKDSIHPGEFMSELRGIFNRERKKIKAKNEQRRQLKQENTGQKAKEKRGSKAKTKMKGFVYVTKKGRKLPYFSGGNRDSKSNKKETANIKHNDLTEMTQSLSDQEDSDDYEYVDAPAKLNSELSMQNSWEDYDDVDIPDTSTSQQLAVEKSNDDVDTRNLSPLPHKGHLLKEAEVQSSRQHQESISGKEHIHHSEFMTALQGIMTKVETERLLKNVKKVRKRQPLQEKRGQKPNLKDQKAKKLKGKKERNLIQKKIKITATSGPTQISNLKRMPDLQSNHIDSGVYDNIDAPVEFYSELDIETSLEIYDDVDIPDASGLSVQTSWEGDLYDDVDIPGPQSQQLDKRYDNVGIMTTPQLPFKAVEDDDYDDVAIPDTRVPPLPQLTANGGNIYEDVDSQSSSLLCAGLDIYEEVQVEEGDEYDDVDIPNTRLDLYEEIQDYENY